MRVKYPIQVDPATVVLQLCLQVEPKSHVTSDDVMKEVLSARGSSDRYPPRRYRIDKIMDIKLGLTVDEGQHEIDVGEIDTAHGYDAVVKALRKARELTLLSTAMIQKIDLSDDIQDGFIPR